MAYRINEEIHKAPFIKSFEFLASVYQNKSNELNINIVCVLAAY